MISLQYSKFIAVKTLAVQFFRRLLFGADEVNRTPDLLITNAFYHRTLRHYARQNN